MIGSLKDFYYLDRRTLENYVSSIEDGIETEKQTILGENKANWSASLSTGELQKVLVAMGIPIPEATVKREGKGKTVTINKTQQPTTSSLYTRLEAYLEPAIQYLHGFDKEIWSQLKEGQFVKFNSNVELSKGYEYSTMFAQVGEFLNLAREIDIPLETMETDSNLESAVKYGEKALGKKIHQVLMKPEGSPNPLKYYFAGGLNVEFLEIDLIDLPNNTYTIVGRIEKILQAGEEHTIFDPTLTGITQTLNREQRRSQKDQLPTGLKEKDMYATKPAIVIRPLVLYK